MQGTWGKNLIGRCIFLDIGDRIQFKSKLLYIIKRPICQIGRLASFYYRIASPFKHIRFH